MNRPLAPAPGMSADAEGASPYVGMLEFATEEYVGGWVCNFRDFDLAVEVELLVDDRLIATTVANIHRDDLKKGGVGRGDHGFLFQARVPEGVLNVRIARTPFILQRHASLETPAVSTAAPRASARDAILRSGLFDRRFYLAANADVAATRIDPLEHFCHTGYKEERRPNLYFDKHDYAAQLPSDVTVENHLLHYIEEGERDNLNPSVLFDVAWYRDQYGIDANQSPLAHYFLNYRTRALSPLPDFDAEYYVRKNPAVRRAGLDPFEHYMQHGLTDGTNPSADFETLFYARRHRDKSGSQHPFVHYLREGKKAGLVTSAAGEATFASEIRKYTAPGPLFEDRAPPSRAQPRAKVLAYYLPQFHAFAENDLWWGAGFTEWTNVVRGVPRFKGHYQPRTPRDLGFYNLLAPGVMRAQIDLARGAGVFGFVFYFYAFGQRRLMEAPLENFVADPSLDFPFCLMWTNEDWTRTWDGVSNDILIAQDYSRNDDDLVDTWLRHFRDPRYIRLEGRPLLMVYRPGLIPEARAKAASWRKRIMAAGEADPILIMAQGFGDADPRLFGLDGAIEFPPHKLAQNLESIAPTLDVFDSGFTAAVVSYDEIVARSLSEPKPPFPLIKTAVPSWDNDARRQGAGLTMHGSTPAAYQAWMDRLVALAERHPFFGENIVAVNAWNEWAEGAYLEPDVHFGAAYLNATARAVFGTALGAASKIGLVGPDAHPDSSLVLHLASTMAQGFGLEVEIVLLDDGKLLPDCHAIARTTVAKNDAELRSTFERLAQAGFRQVVLNSAASCRAARWAAEAGLEVILLVHELPLMAAQMNLAASMGEAIPFVRQFVFPAAFARDKMLAHFDIDPERSRVRAPGAYRQIAFSQSARASTRSALGIGDGDTMALGVGRADLRNGFDLFLQSWRGSERRATGAHFVWMGELDASLQAYLAPEIGTATSSGRFHLLPATKQIGPYYSAADVLLIASREDAFPAVALDALQAGVPTIAFEGSGGAPALLRRYHAGAVAPMADCESVVDRLVELGGRPADAPRGPDHPLARIAREAFSFPQYAFDLISAGRVRRLKISVVVPNYNYARYLTARLRSIFEQTAPIFELIVLDDGSTDESLAVLKEIATASGRMFAVVPNAVNSGSVFRQWRKAVELASGDYIWIAEADDMAEPTLLERLAAQIVDSDNEFSLCYADSRAVDEDGVEISANYKSYYRESAPDVFEKNRVFDGAEFVRDHLADRNLILNVSACLWRRSVLYEAIEAVGDDLLSYQLAGDWFLYVTALNGAGGKVAYVSEPLNIHRRHRVSVTRGRLTPQRHVEEIREVQLRVRELYGVDAQMAWRQDSYLATVATQLGAAETAEAALNERRVTTRPTFERA